MKKFFTYLMVAIATLIMPSCGSGDDNKKEDEPKATNIDFSKKDAIVGKWFETESMSDYDGTFSKSDDIEITFRPDGSFDMYYGYKGSLHAKGTYTYTPKDKNNGSAVGMSEGLKFNFTFSNYKEFRYKIVVDYDNIYGIHNSFTSIYGHFDEIN